MIYYGIDLHHDSLEIAALSEGFAHLESKYFTCDEFHKLHNWADSFKFKPDEICYWFFDDFEFNKYDHPLSLFPYYDTNNKIYLVNHRKLLNLIQFFYEWSIEKEEYYILDLNNAFLLASSVRLFDFENMKLLELESSLENEQPF